MPIIKSQMCPFQLLRLPSEFYHIFEVKFARSVRRSDQRAGSGVTEKRRENVEKWERKAKGQKTHTNPSRSPSRRHWSNLAGVTHSFTAKCLLVGCMYWPRVSASTPALRRSRIVCSTSGSTSPRPSMMELLVSKPGFVCGDCQHSGHFSWIDRSIDHHYSIQSPSSRAPKPVGIGRTLPVDPAPTESFVELECDGLTNQQGNHIIAVIRADLSPRCAQTLPARSWPQPRHSPNFQQSRAPNTPQAHPDTVPSSV